MFIFPMYYLPILSNHSNLKVSDATNVTEEIKTYFENNNLYITSENLAKELNEPKERIVGCLITLKKRGVVNYYIKDGLKYWKLAEKEN